MLAHSEIIVGIEGLNKWFGALHVLNNIDLDVASGARVVVCGPSGSGKSTLIRCINGLESYQEGTLRLAGTTLGLNAAETAAARRQTGMVFQSFNLFPHLTVLSNCTLALRRVAGRSRSEAEDIAMAHLEKVRIPEKAMSYPAQLSGGQQQRVAIARALCLNPRIMLFDEPTSALDPELVGEVLNVIRSLADEGRTMILVTHEMKFAREVANHVIYLYNGLIEEEGPPDQLFGAPKSERLKQFLKSVG